MTIEQLINQFFFRSMAEARRSVQQGVVRINEYMLQTQDLHRPANQLAKVGDTLHIGKYATFKILEHHLLG